MFPSGPCDFGQPSTCTEEPVVEPTMDPEPLIDQRYVVPMAPEGALKVCVEPRH